jgi:hypothetical protein
MGEHERFQTEGFSADDDGLEEDGPLVDRLRRLQWPNVDDDTRQRSWERFQRILAGEEELPQPPAAEER